MQVHLHVFTSLQASPRRNATNDSVAGKRDISNLADPWNIERASGSFATSSAVS
jgi:hypothetical protein